MSTQFDPDIHTKPLNSDESALHTIMQRLSQKIQLDQAVQQTTDVLRASLQVDRVVLYYFYTQWQGRVTFESLSDPAFSIFGCTGPDQCFTDEYAALYLAGRVRAIPDIEAEPIEPCHRDFLRHLQVRANLVAPILTANGLWGLLVAHHCQGPKAWSNAELDQIQAAAGKLATTSSIQDVG